MIIPCAPHPAPLPDDGEREQHVCPVRARAFSLRAPAGPSAAADEAEQIERTASIKIWTHRRAPHVWRVMRFLLRVVRRGGFAENRMPSVSSLATASQNCHHRRRNRRSHGVVVLVCQPVTCAHGARMLFPLPVVGERGGVRGEGHMG